MRKLDERMRRRLGELAESERSPLGSVERQRIVARAGELEVRGRTGGMLWLALAASVAGLVLWQASSRDGERWAEPTLAPSPPPAADVGPRRAPLSDPGQAPPPEHESVAPPAHRACDDAPAPSPAAPVARRDGSGAIDLGQRARFVLFDDAEGRFETVERCRTTFVLERGRAVVHARELLGGELVVRTPAADVVVHGTVFDVRLGPGGERLEVAVAEGEVGVVGREPAAEQAVLEPGQGLALEDGAIVRRSLGTPDVEALLGAVTDAPVPRRRPRVRRPPEPQAPTPRGEVVGGVPQVHQPRWTSDR